MSVRVMHMPCLCDGCAAKAADLARVTRERDEAARERDAARAEVADVIGTSRPSCVKHGPWKLGHSCPGCNVDSIVTLRTQRDIARAQLERLQAERDEIAERGAR
jgi:hypothetical protein